MNTIKDFKKEVLEEKRPVIVDFYADWCGPCQMMKPVFEKLGDEMKATVAFKKLDTEELGDIAAEYGVMSIPTLIVFKEGKEAGRKTGFQNESDLRNWVSTFA